MSIYIKNDLFVKKIEIPPKIQPCLVFIPTNCWRNCVKYIIIQTEKLHIRISPVRVSVCPGPGGSLIYSVLLVWLQPGNDVLVSRNSPGLTARHPLSLMLRPARQVSECSE